MGVHYFIGIGGIVILMCIWGGVMYLSGQLSQSIEAVIEDHHQEGGCLHCSAKTGCSTNIIKS